MDFNYLLGREQVERMRAERTACDEARAAHLHLADAYRSVVEGQRRRRIAAAALGAELRRPAL